jgi:hypothetical protein
MLLKCKQQGKALSKQDNQKCDIHTVTVGDIHTVTVGDIHTVTVGDIHTVTVGDILNINHHDPIP